MVNMERWRAAKKCGGEGLDALTWCISPPLVKEPALVIEELEELHWVGIEKCISSSVSRTDLFSV